MSAEPRRDPRVSLRLRVVLIISGKDVPVFTEDISMQGLRVRADLKLPPRQLLRMRLPVGENEAELICQGMVVHTDPSEVDGTPSVGIQFYAFDGAVRDAWSKLVVDTRRAGQLKTPVPPPPIAAVPIPAGPPPIPKRPPPIPAAPPPVPVEEPIRRKHPRKSARITVYISSMDDLITFTTLDVSRGGMFLATPTPLPVGERVRLEMKSPDTNPFSVEAIVRRVDLESDPPGMGLEFLPQAEGDQADGDKLDELFDNVFQEEPVLVAAYDPNLA